MRHLKPLIAPTAEPLLRDSLSESWFVAAADVARFGVMQADGRVGVILAASGFGARLQLGPLTPDSPRVQANAMRLGPEASLLGARFEPGAFRNLFGLSYRAFLGGQSSEQLRSWQRDAGDILRELASETTSWEQAHAALGAALAALLREPDERWARIQRTLPELSATGSSASGSSASLDQLARQSGFSRRQFERVFAEHVGMSPKVYQRTQRVNRARKQLRTGSTPAETAQRTGFADQAHLTREFRQLLGVTPLQYQRRIPSDVPQ